MLHIGIVGYGFVGKATHLLQNPETSVSIYDIAPDLCVPSGTTLKDIDSLCDLVFLCLPTPLHHDGSCNTSILEKILHQMQNSYIVIRSTVPVGFCREHNCFFMPEFLTEKGWRKDFKENPLWVFGTLHGSDEETCERNTLFCDRVQRLLQSAHTYGSIDTSSFMFLTSTEAEMVKLVKNVFLSVKVSFFNEIYDLCTKYTIDYNSIITAVKADDRIGRSHMQVPGHDTRRGYGGTCFPKDANNLFSVFQENGLSSKVIEASLDRNEYTDRREKDWLGDRGRTFIDTGSMTILVLCVGPMSHECRTHVEKEMNNGNMIILLHNTDIDIAPHPLLWCKKVSFTAKLFFPRLDKICLFITRYLYADVVLGNNVAELALLHKCPVMYPNNDDIWDKILLEYDVARTSL